MVLICLLSSLLGSIIVIIGLYILLWGKKKEMQKCVTKLAQEAEAIKELEQPLPIKEPEQPLPIKEPEQPLSVIRVSVDDSRCP